MNSRTRCHRAGRQPVTVILVDKPFALKVYSGTGHAFTAPDGGAYNPQAASDAWEEAIRFLDRHLRA